MKETSLLRTIEDKNSWSQNVPYLEVSLYYTARVVSFPSSPMCDIEELKELGDRATTKTNN